MKIISNIFKKIYKGIFFDSSTETDYTLFNHYIIEIIPEMKNFFKILIDVTLPKQIEDLLLTCISRTEDSEEFELIPQQPINYNFFAENPEELIKMECICFTIQDILTIWHLFIEDKLFFKQDNIFYKSLEKLYYQENSLKDLYQKDPNIKYFLVFDTQNNPDKIKYLKKDQLSLTFTDDIKNNEFILQRVKFCIKIVLRGLNLINKKVYSLLFDAETNLKFLEIINKIIQIEEELCQNYFSNKIPPTWYSLYMKNNIRNIPFEYQENNFNKLYEEILIEATQKIVFLKEKSNIVITQFGINMRCAEELIERSHRDLIFMNRIEKYVKIDWFIRNTNIEVCVKYNKKEPGKPGMQGSIIGVDKKDNIEWLDITLNILFLIFSDTCLKKINFF